MVDRNDPSDIDPTPKDYAGFCQARTWWIRCCGEPAYSAEMIADGIHRQGLRNMSRDTFPNEPEIERTAAAYGRAAGGTVWVLRRDLDKVLVDLGLFTGGAALEEAIEHGFIETDELESQLWDEAKALVSEAAGEPVYGLDELRPAFAALSPFTFETAVRKFDAFASYAERHGKIIHGHTETRISLERFVTQSNLRKLLGNTGYGHLTLEEIDKKLQELDDNPSYRDRILIDLGDEIIFRDE